ARGPGLERVVKFIADLIDTVSARYKIDRSRIYANGLSNGGGMAFALSCTMSDRIAAVGLVASAQTLPWSWCTDTKPIPMIAFHGTADPIIPFDGGTTWISSRAFPSIPRWCANWAKRNGCDPVPKERVVAADVTLREYARCTDDATVALYIVRGG